jgi:hypothetical protein
LLVFNSGTESFAYTADRFNETLNWIFTTFNSSVSVIYRNSVPGHVHCESSFRSPPLTKPQNISIYDEYHNRSEKHYTEDYNWFAIYETNKAIHQIWKTRYPQVLYLNVYPSTVLRAESHKIVYRGFNWSHPKVGDAPYYTPTLKPQPDCLHYCIPGPLDTYVILLFNILLLFDNLQSN